MHVESMDAHAALGLDDLAYDALESEGLARSALAGHQHVAVQGGVLTPCYRQPLLSLQGSLIGAEDDLNGVGSHSGNRLERKPETA